MTQARPDNPVILIVEDHDAMRAMLRLHVQSARPECFVIEAVNGATALALCRTYRPQLVLLDIGLPDADGIELGARLKRLAPDAALIVVSQHAGHTYVERTRDMGALAYVTKDRIFEELGAWMTRALEAELCGCAGAAP